MVVYLFIEFKGVVWSVFIVYTRNGCVCGCGGLRGLKG